MAASVRAEARLPSPASVCCWGPCLIEVSPCVIKMPDLLFGAFQTSWPLSLLSALSSVVLRAETRSLF